MGRPRKNVKANGNYWNEVQEKAVIDYHTETDPVIRDRIFTLYLYPQLHAMSSTILKRYFKMDDETLVFDSVAHVVEKALNKFDASRAKSFSYFQTVIKHYFYDALGTRSPVRRKARLLEPLDNFDDNVYTELQTPSDEIWVEVVKIDYADTVLNRLNTLRRQDLNKKSYLMLEYFIEILTSKRIYTNEYVTLALLVLLDCNHYTSLRYYAEPLGIKFRFSMTSRINNILKRYADDHGLVFTKHDLQTIEPWQEIALNQTITNLELIH